MLSNKTQTIEIVPHGYTSVTPWIISRDTDAMIRFLEAVFDAEEVPNSRIKNVDGVIIHAVVKTGSAMVMLFDWRAGWGATPTYLNVYVADIEKAFRKALEMGAIVVTEITTLWFGEKVCRILDPFGNLLWINQRMEEIDFTDAEQVGKRASSAEAVEGIAYIQQSLDEAMKKQKSFFKDQH